jgi:hypothetical protein
MASMSPIVISSLSKAMNTKTIPMLPKSLGKLISRQEAPLLASHDDHKPLTIAADILWPSRRSQRGIETWVYRLGNSVM